jgi:hypothetical protein
MSQDFKSSLMSAEGSIQSEEESTNEPATEMSGHSENVVVLSNSHAASSQQAGDVKTQIIG